jgi:hypothetical protein
MYQFPKQAEFNKVLPKSKIYSHAKPGRGVRELFVSEINEIVWKFKLSPDTINLPAKDWIEEIQVFEIELKTQELDESVLLAIDKAIHFPILYQLRFQDQVKFVAGYKRPNEADVSKLVMEAYFESPWQLEDAPRGPLPMVLDLAALYEDILRSMIPIPRTSGESLRDQVSRVLEIRAKERQCQELESNLTKEKQFNRKVEINSALRSTKAQLDQLSPVKPG